MPISGKTKVALIRALASRGHSGISLLAIELDLDGRAVGGNRLDRCMSLVKAIETEREPNKAVKVLLDLAEGQLKAYSEWSLENDSDAMHSSVPSSLMATRLTASVSFQRCQGQSP